jgi:hypothetical protein
MSLTPSVLISFDDIPFKNKEVNNCLHDETINLLVSGNQDLPNLWHALPLHEFLESVVCCLPAPLAARGQNCYQDCTDSLAE